MIRPQWKCAFVFSLFMFGLEVSAEQTASEPSHLSSSSDLKPEGWSLDIGGTYTWMSFTTPPTYSGSTGGVLGKVTYQKPWAFFGQGRSFYNLGPLSSSTNDASFHEWYLELVGGYSFPLLKNWSITPYAGLGIDYLHDHHSAYSTIEAIKLRYSTYYAVAGFDTHYAWKSWMLGLQADCLPVFNQYLNIAGESEAAWILSSRTGIAVRLPVAYRFAKNYWLELTPYYRWLPVGSSQVLGLPHRNLDQWGGFLTFRFFL